MQSLMKASAYTCAYSTHAVLVGILALVFSVPIHFGLLAGAQSLLLSSIFHGMDVQTLLVNASSKSAPFSAGVSNGFAWLLRAPGLSCTGEDIRINVHVALGMLSFFSGLAMALVLSGFLSPRYGLVSAHVASLAEHYGDANFYERAWSGLSKCNYFMRRYFTHRYSNDVSGLAYIGAAILIGVIGLRGLKIIPPTQPTPVLAAISLEFCLLMLLGITLYFTPEDNEDLIVHNQEHSASIGQPLIATPPIIAVPEGTMVVSDQGSVHIPEALIRQVMMDIMRESMDTARSVSKPL